MSFIQRIKKRIRNYKNSDFRKSVAEEKQRTYLFRNNDSFFEPQRKGIFHTKNKKLQSFSNFFQNKASRFHELRQNTAILGLLAVILLALSGYIIFYSSYFKITPSRVMIEGEGQGVDINIAHRSIENLYGMNFFSVDESDIALSLKKYQKNIKSVTIDKLYPNGIKVILKGFPIQYRAEVFGIEDKSWGITSNGVLIPENNVKINENTPKLSIYSSTLSEELFLDYKSVITERSMALIENIRKYFLGEFSGFNIGIIRYYANENEIHIALESGTYILLALDDTIEKQLLSLKTYVLQNRELLQNGSTTYVDARVNGKIFVCKEARICKANLVQVYGKSYQ